MSTILIFLILVIIIILWFKRSNKSSNNFSSKSIEYTFEIVGEQSCQRNLRKLAGEKEEESKFVEVTAKVLSDPFNKFDKNAVKVEIDGLLVGFLSKEQAKLLSGKVINKEVPAVIDGGWLDDESEGSYGVKLGINNLNELVD